MAEISCVRSSGVDYYYRDKELITDKKELKKVEGTVECTSPALKPVGKGTTKSSYTCVKQGSILHYMKNKKDVPAKDVPPDIRLGLESNCPKAAPPPIPRKATAAVKAARLAKEKAVPKKEPGKFTKAGYRGKVLPPVPGVKKKQPHPPLHPKPK
jgi:hypothetical protein